jgi:hypothetical protein
MGRKLEAAVTTRRETRDGVRNGAKKTTDISEMTSGEIMGVEMMEGSSWQHVGKDEGWWMEG